MSRNLFRILLLLPFAYWAYLIFFTDLGADPAKRLNHKTGEIALYYILLNLLIGALISFKFKFPTWSRFLLLSRRYLGVLSFLILVAHVFFYFAMESFAFKAVEQLYTKTYLIAAGLAFLILAALAITSNDFSVRKMKIKNWKRLHRFVYLASFFFSVHVLLIEKTDLVKYGLIVAGLWLIQGARFIYLFYSRKAKTA